MPKIAVLIPCYNEEMTIAKVIDDFRAVLPDSCIYVYNNNSKDKSVEIAEKHGAVVVNEYQQGKGFVIRSMFRDIEADCYIMADGDDTYEVSDVLKMAEAILTGQADMAIGDRLSGTYFTENKRPFHNTGNRMVKGLINRIFRSQVKDIMTGCRAFSRRFVKTFPILSRGFEIETEMTIHALDKRLALVEMPVGYRDRPEGSDSKLNTVSDGIRVIKTIFSLFKDYRPLAFFGLLALAFLAASVGFFIPVLIEYVKTGLVPKLPTMLLSVGLGIISLLSFVCGIILDTIKKYNDRTYELFVTLMEKKKEQ